MKRIITLALMLALVVASKAQVPGADLVISSTDTPGGIYPTIGGIRGHMSFKINPDSTTLTLIGLDPLADTLEFIGNSLHLPANITVGDDEDAIVYTVTDIGGRGFSGSGTLINRCHSIYLPPTIKTIGPGTFTQLEMDSLTICGGIETIADSAFIGPSQPYPNGYRYMEDYFNFRGSLQQWLDLDILGEYGSPLSWSKMLYMDDTVLTNLVIPEGIYSLKPYHFAWTKGIVNLTLPSTLDSLGANTFKFCLRLDSIYLPYNLRYIGDHCFYGCRDLRVVDYRAINCRYAGSLYQTIFANCNYVSVLYINELVQYLPDYLFMNLSNITNVYLPAGLREVGDLTFAQCTSLRGKLTLPEGLQYLGASAFASCPFIDTLEFNPRLCTCPGGTEYYPFAHDDGIRVLEIGRNVQVLPNSVFRGANNIERIISHAIVPPFVPSDAALADIDEGAYLTVPCGAEWDYREAYGWNKFLTIRSTEMFQFDITSNNDTMGYVEVPSLPQCDYLYGEIWAHANEGYLFDHWSDGNTQEHRWIAVEGDTAIVAHFAPIPEGINDHDASHARIYAQQHSIVVDGAENRLICITDILGRTLHAGRISGSNRFTVPGPGIYIVTLGNDTIRKVVVK